MKKIIKKLSYTKIIFAAFFLVLFGIIFSLNSATNIKAIAATWWNPAWNYKAPIIITETSKTTLTDYQVKISVPYSSKMRSDYGDIRFIDNTDASELSYWREAYSGTSATFWVKIPSLSASGTTSIYMYYGNSAAITTSNIHNTFLWGDDFENSTWTGSNIHQVNYAASRVLPLQYIQNGQYHMSGPKLSEPIAEIYQGTSLKSFPNNYTVEVDFKPIVKTGGAYIDPRYNSVANKYESLIDIQYSAADVNKVVKNVWKKLQTIPLNVTINTGNTYRLKAVTLREGTTNRLQVYLNNVMYINRTDSSLNYPGLAFLTYDWDDAFHVAYDNFRVRQYASKEPTNLIGAEQQSGSTPIATPTPTATATPTPTATATPTPTQGKGNTTGIVTNTPVSSGAANEYNLTLTITNTTVSGISVGQQVWLAATTIDFPNLLTVGASITGDLDNSLGWWIMKRAAGTTPAAKIVFTFDDGWTDQYTYAFPIMQAAGFKGTAYVMRDATTEPWPDMMNISQVNALYNAGWDISNHTTNHDDYGADTSAIRLAALTTEYQQNQEWIVSNGWTRGAYHVCYPSGAFSDQLISILKGMGVLTGRAVIDGNQSIPVTDFFRIPVQYVEAGNVAAVDSSVDSAIQSGSTVVLMIHRVMPAAGDLIITTSDFQKIVDYVKAKSSSIAVMTMSEWYASQGK